MRFWEIIKVICNIPFGIAAICGSVIVGMIAFIGCSLCGYFFWVWIFDRISIDCRIFGRKDAQEEEQD